MRSLTPADFEALVGETFTVDGQEGASLRLSRILRLSHSLREGGGFRLELEGPREPVLPQAIYTLRSGDDPFEIFIVPVGQSQSATAYEAIFN